MDHVTKSNYFQKRALQSLLIAVVVSSGTVLVAQQAEARQSTKSFTCEGLKEYIEDNGDVVMSHKNSSLYRRFVSSEDDCDEGRIVRILSVPTKTGRCSLKICVTGDDD